MSRRPRTHARSVISLLASATLGLATFAVVLVSRPSTATAMTRTAAVTSASRYARDHGYRVGISVLDTRTGRLYSGGAHRGSFASESVVKVFIATRLILQGRMHGRTASRAYRMITRSDDGIASSFYGSVGGDSLITWIKRHYHVPSLGSRPHRRNWWGNTHITSDGLVRLYAKLKADRRVGPWLLRAMHHTTKYGADGVYQWFGLRSANRHAAVKQGWGTDFDDWSTSADYNTTGFVNGDRYAVAILSRGPASRYGTRIGAMLTTAAKRLLPHGVFPAAAPRVTSLSTHRSPTRGGATVIVHGTDFTHVTRVTFGGKAGTSVHVKSARTLTVRAPSHRAMRLWVRVSTNHGRSGAGFRSRFEYLAAPVVTKVSPGSGSSAGGTAVTITGGPFTASTRVTFDGVKARSIEVRSRTSVRVVAPAHGEGTAKVVVRTYYGTSREVHFSYVGTS